MGNSLKTVIDQSKAILILLPIDPVFDQVAAATSLYLALSQEAGLPAQSGKEVNIFCPTPMIVEFNKLVAVNKIKNEIGNKNLGITFENYNPQGIEKVSWDIEHGQFKLTVVPKVNVAPPTKEQVVIAYAGVAAELVILIGGGSEADFPAVVTEDLKSAQVAHIGISELNITGRTVSSFATAASSISEVVANLIKGANYKIDVDIATDLLMGIEEGTKGFTTGGVTADTFALMSELMKAGGKRFNQKDAQNNNYQATPMGIPGMPSQVPSSWTEPKIFKGTSVS